MRELIEAARKAASVLPLHTEDCGGHLVCGEACGRLPIHGLLDAMVKAEEAMR